MSASRAREWCGIISEIFLLVGCLIVFTTDDSVMHDLLQLSIAIGFILFGVTSFLKKRMKEG